jgi:hypothetical protein
MSEPEWETIPMFEVPKKYRPPKKPDNWPKWTAYHAKRTSCDTCILDIAEGRRAFLSQPAAWVREDAHSRRFLCVRHAIDKKKEDGVE